MSCSPERDTHTAISPEPRPSTSKSKDARLGKAPHKGLCWACEAPSLPGKLICSSCLADATGEQEQQQQDVVGLIKQVVRDSLQEFTAHKELPGTSTASTARPPVSPQEDQQDSSDGEVLEENTPSVFDFALVEPFVTAVKQAIQWEDSTETPAKKGKYFPQLQRKAVTFPFMEEIRDLVLDEWKKVDKRPVPQNRLHKMYPLAQEEASLLDSAPIVDASVMRLARNTTLPLEDSTSFRDVLDRRIDADLKKTYLTAGAACRPMVALTSVSRAVRSWTENIEVALQQNMDPDSIIPALEELKLAADFMAEAAIDSLRSSARSMLYAVTARRALWLKPWSADPMSKQTWCRIPFDGKSLFGEKLDTAISRVTGGKSGLIPQDRSRKRKFFARPNFQQRSKDARSYRPGREFKRNWRGTQATFLRKQKGTSPAQTEAKSF